VTVQSNPARVGPFLVAAIVALACLATPVAHVSRAAPIQRELFDDLYARGQALNGGLKTLTAAFAETSTSALLTRPMAARGTVFVDRPSRIALRYAEPDDRTILIDGDRMTISWPSAPPRTADISATQRRIQKYFVDSSPSELRSHFEIDAREADDRPGAYLVTMTPRRKQIQAGLARLELWLDRESLLPAAMRMTFPGGDTKLMTFTGVQTNVSIDPAVFRIGAGSAR
jgi:outer membrane lipoprotein carrier protein